MRRGALSNGDDGVRLLSLAMSFIFPTAWALHVTGKCYCRDRAQCQYSKYWTTTRRDLPSDERFI